MKDYFKWKELDKVEDSTSFTPQQLHQSLKSLTEDWSLSEGKLTYINEEESILAEKYLNKHNYETSSVNINEEYIVSFNKLEEKKKNKKSKIKTVPALQIIPNPGDSIKFFNHVMGADNNCGDGEVGTGLSEGVSVDNPSLKKAIGYLNRNPNHFGYICSYLNSRTHQQVIVNRGFKTEKELNNYVNNLFKDKNVIDVSVMRQGEQQKYSDALKLTKKDLNEEFTRIAKEEEDWLDKKIEEHNFKIVSKQDYGYDKNYVNVHYQIISNEGNKTKEDLDKEADWIDSLLDEFEDMTGSPCTYNMGLQTDGYISAGFDCRAIYYEPGNDIIHKKSDHLRFKNGKPADDYTKAQLKDIGTKMGIDNPEDFIPVDKPIKKESLNNFGNTSIGNNYDFYIVENEKGEGLGEAGEFYSDPDKWVKFEYEDEAESALIDFPGCSIKGIREENLEEELWPKEHNESTAKSFEEKEVMKSKVRDWFAAEKPCEFQIEDIPADLTWEEVIKAYKENKEPRGGLPLDTEPREYIWQRAGELYYLQTGEFLDSDFERIYKEKRTDLQTPEEKVEGEKMLSVRIGFPENGEEVAIEEKPVEEPIEEDIEKHDTVTESFIVKSAPSELDNPDFGNILSANGHSFTNDPADYMIFKSKKDAEEFMNNEFIAGRDTLNYSIEKLKEDIETHDELKEEKILIKDVTDWVATAIGYDGVMARTPLKGQVKSKQDIINYIDKLSSQKINMPKWKRLFLSSDNNQFVWVFDIDKDGKWESSKGDYNEFKKIKSESLIESIEEYQDELGYDSFKRLGNKVELTFNDVEKAEKAFDKIKNLDNTEARLESGSKLGETKILYWKKELEEDIEKHDTLNPKLFDKEELKPEIRESIQKIVNTFIEELAEDEVKVLLKDIVLLGSNVSYNYTKDSDLDIHLIVDSNALACPPELTDKLYSAYRSIFNKNYDIKIKGIPVEIYVELDEPKAISNGIYSLNNGWLKKPEVKEIPELDEETFEAEFKKWEDRYFNLIDSLDTPENLNYTKVEEGENMDKNKKLVEEDESDFDSRFDEKFGTGTDVFDANDYLKRMKEMKEFK